ncbi:MAG: GNAT family N-acetyltransferase [Saprospiraceae bacterium]
MTPEDKMNICITTDPHHIEICARMMTGSDPWITLKMNYDNCLKAFDGPSKEIYVIEQEGNIEGFAVLQLAGTFKGYIQTICIRENRRGNGLGKKLLQFCEYRILKISPNIFICVSSFNSGAIRLYENFGFKNVGKLDNFVKEGFAELLFRKTVGPLLK